MCVDGAELSHVESDSLRRRLVGHPQKFVVNNSGSVRENLDPAGDVSDARVEEVIRQVMTPEMCAEIMSKLDAKWNGCSFSEGWQQHIGICRTLLRDSAVYVLDEPTSGYVVSPVRHGVGRTITDDSHQNEREAPHGGSGCNFRHHGRKDGHHHHAYADGYSKV